MDESSITTPAEIETKKTCTRCRRVLALSEFHKGDGIGGRRADCRTCHSASDSADYWADPETARAKARERRAKKPEVYRAHGLKSYRKRKEAVLSLKRAKYSENAEMFRELSRSYRRAKPWVPLIAKARSRSAKAGIAFNLTAEWGAREWTGRCAVTGVEFQPDRNRRWSASIDRIIPALGYVQANCRFVLWSVNCLKNDGTDAEMHEVARLIVGAANGV